MIKLCARRGAGCLEWWCAQGGSKEAFFFEKKNQKTFDY
jgi:hypothetical protein